MALVTSLLTPDARRRISEAPAARLLERFGGLAALSRAGARELVADGHLEARAAQRLVSAFELGRRAVDAPWDADRPLCDAEDVWAHYRACLGTLGQEVFVAIGLDVRCRRVCEVRVAEGSLARCAVHPRDVFLPLLRSAAYQAVLVHNHPSGDPTPSLDDRRLTLRLARAGALLGVEVTDHIIVARSGYHSMAEEGVLPCHGA